MEKEQGKDEIGEPVVKATTLLEFILSRRTENDTEILDEIVSNLEDALTPEKEEEVKEPEPIQVDLQKRGRGRPPKPKPEDDEESLIE